MSKRSDQEYADALYAEAIAAAKAGGRAASDKVIDRMIAEGPGTRSENLDLAEAARTRWRRNHS